MVRAGRDPGRRGPPTGSESHECHAVVPRLACSGRIRTGRGGSCGSAAAPRPTPDRTAAARAASWPESARSQDGVLDPSSRGPGDRAGDGGPVSPRSRLARDAAVGLVIAEAVPSGSGARRPGDPGLDQENPTPGTRKPRAEKPMSPSLTKAASRGGRPSVGSWAPRGQTPVLRHRHRTWSQLSRWGTASSTTRARRASVGRPERSS